MSEELDRYKEIAIAVVELAVEDYKWYLKEKEKGFKSRKDYKLNDSYLRYRNCVENGIDAEKFLSSAMVYMYTGISPNINLCEVVKKNLHKKTEEKYDEYKRVYEAQRSKAKRASKGTKEVRA